MLGLYFGYRCSADVVTFYDFWKKHIRLKFIVITFQRFFPFHFVLWQWSSRSPPAAPFCISFQCCWAPEFPSFLLVTSPDFYDFRDLMSVVYHFVFVLVLRLCLSGWSTSTSSSHIHILLTDSGWLAGWLYSWMEMNEQTDWRKLKT